MKLFFEVFSILGYSSKKSSSIKGGAEVFYVVLCFYLIKRRVVKSINLLDIVLINAIVKKAALVNKI